MSQQDVLRTLTRVLRDILSDDNIVLTMDTRRDEVPNWDSLSYVTFVVTVELEFGVSFTVAEVESFPDVGSIVNRIAALKPA
jgi:acyl carrier protein